MPIELYPSVAKIKRNGVYENLPGFVPETGSVATQQMIATGESINVAQYVHNKGEYFRLNDTLYQAIVKINVGDNIVVGTNCEVAVIGNDLTHVANSIAAYELGIATSSHNTGDYFMVGETLYVATSDIQVGDTISTSTNCRLAVVGDELSGLKTALNEYVIDRYGSVFSKNLITSEVSLTQGYIAQNGTIGSSTTLAYTDYLPVESGAVLRTYFVSSGVLQAYSFRLMCCYNANKEVISSAGTANVSTFTVPNGVAYVRATVYKDANKTNHMVTENYVATSYIEYDAPKRLIEDDFLSTESQVIINEFKQGAIKSSRLANNYHCSFPKQKIKLTQGIEESFYYYSAVFPPKTTYADLNIGIEYSKKYDNRVFFKNINTLTSANGYSWVVRDAFYSVINSYSGSGGLGGRRSIVAENLANCSLLAIGDSTVDQDVMTQSLLDYFTSKSKTITLLGTLGSGDNKNEGRAGWKASDYLTNKQYDGVTNPFYNPTTQTFDFSYYMTNQNYSSVDFVVLQLGINDLSNNTSAETLWETMKVLIDSILDYNSSIKIILNLPTTPNSDQSETSAVLMNYLLSVCSYNEYALAHILSEYNGANVRASYCHLILDPDTDINDNVHPTETGYEKMALEIINQINHWQNND